MSPPWGWTAALCLILFSVARLTGRHDVSMAMLGLAIYCKLCEARK